MSKFQFNHKLYRFDKKFNLIRNCVAIEVPTKSDLLDLLSFYFSKTIKVNMGIARTNPEDNYVKQTGRDIAVKKVKETVLTLDKIVIDKQDIYLYHFKDQANNLEHIFKVLAGTEKVHYIASNDPNRIDI